MHVEAREQAVRQATIMLPYFEQEVPALYVADGTPYIPVISLCQILGLRANTHIPRWRKLMLWRHARKLPWRTPTGHTRVVWCLHVGALPSWCCSFDWSLVTPVRRAQLHQATDAWLKVTEQAQQEMLREYRQMRRQLFEFLMAYMDTDTLLSRLTLHLRPLLNSTDAHVQFEELMNNGRFLVQEATNHARDKLYAQASIPIMDVVRLDEDGQVKEEMCSLPLFPVVPKEERTQFFAYLDRLSVWHREFVAFLKSIAKR
jgi:hypothetical protein